MRATRWLIAALIGSAMTTIGCAAPVVEEPAVRVRVPVVDDHSLAHAVEASVEMRVRDRIELDRSLWSREIDVRTVDGTVEIRGEVWTEAEKKRVSDLIRGVAGVSDVANELDVRPPR